MKLKDLLGVIHCQIELSTPQELKDACHLISRVQDMTNGERDCIIAAFKQGPLFDGDVPSKRDRDTLMQEGFMVRVAVQGTTGHNGCSSLGCRAYYLIQAEKEAQDKIKQQS